MTVRPAPPPPPSETGDTASDDPLEPGRGEPRFDERREQDARAPYEGRSSFDRILPELIRRGLEAGRGPLEKVSESIFPKELTSQLAAQLGDVRSGLVKAVAHEVNRFLREADIAAEVRKVLIGLDVEAHVKLRFKAREDGSLKPELDVDLGGDERPRGERKKR